ncbi:unnamed protein product, partial [Heterotrigona itama]
MNSLGIAMRAHCAFPWRAISNSPPYTIALNFIKRTLR